MDRKQERRVKIKVMNIALYPEVRQKPENYVAILRRIYDTKFEVATYGDRHMRLMSQIEDDGVIYGKMANFVKIDPEKPSIDLHTNTEVEVEQDSKYGSNLKKWDYFFIPAAHRFVIIANEASESQVKRFLTYAFDYGKDDDEEVEVSVEKTADVIEKILKAYAVSRLYVRTSFSNNDNYEGWAKVIDEQYRGSGVRSSTIELKGTKKEPIDIGKSELIQAHVQMSKSYGYAEATIIDEEGRVSSVKTENHPLVTEVSFVDSLAESIKRVILNLFKRKN